MYKRHKIIITFLFGVIFLVAFLLNADYLKIAESAISVVSIALAVYIGAASVILGSSFSSKLKSQQDVKIREKTSLGVLASYLRVAGFCGLATIAISVIYILKLDLQYVHELFAKFQYGGISFETIQRILSSVSCGLFAVNIFFIWLILLFLINSMTKAV